MKNLKKSFLALACTLCVMNGVSAAEQPMTEIEKPADVKIEQKVEQKAIIPLTVRDVLSTTGKITAIDGNRITVKGEGQFSEVVVVVTDNTYIADGKKGKIKKMKNLKVGKEVTVYYSSKMTRSLPPQAEAYAVVIGKDIIKQGKFFKVEKVITNKEEKLIKVVNSNQDIIATITEDVYEDYAQIKEGDNLLLWYDIMTMSMPGQTNAYKVVVLPEIEK